MGRRLVITQRAELPPRDRSSDRNAQHHAALEHHRRTPDGHVGPIGDLPASVNRGPPPSLTNEGRLAGCVPLRAPSPGHQRSPLAPITGYPQVSILLVRAMIAARSFKLAMGIRFVAHLTTRRPGRASPRAKDVVRLRIAR